ncbi:MAG: TonB-dependent receptor [Pseudomonadota bacterium]
MPILFDPNNVTSNPSDPRLVNSDDSAATDFDVLGVTGTLNWEADSFSIKSITGFYNNEIAPRTGFDQYNATIPDPADPTLPPFTFFIPPPPGSGLPPTPITDGSAFDFLIGRSSGLGISFVNDSTQISQEINVASATDGPFEWIAGLYYFREQVDFVLEGDALPHLFFTPLNPAFAGFPEFGLFNSADFTSRSYAAFASGTYSFGDAVRIRGGVRYNYDEKEADLVEHVPVSGIVLAQDSPNEDWSAVTGNVGLDWFATEDTMIYGSISRGYKAGAINLVNSTDNIVDPETIWSYEIGTKSRLLDNRLQLNTAAFYSDYKDLQVNFFEPGGVVLRNADSAEVIGVEVDVVAVPTDRITLTGAFAWTHAEYTEFVTDNPFTGETGVNLSGNRLNQTPEIAFNIGAEVILPVAESVAELTFFVDHTWKDEIDYQAFNTGLTRGDSFGLTNLRLQARAPGAESWRVELFVNNVQNTDAVQSIQLPPTLSPENSANPLTAVHYRPPRTFGVTVGYDF